MSRRRAPPNGPGVVHADDIELRGSLDSVEPDGRVFGWCWSPNDPGVRRRVAVLVDGQEATRAVADVLREDLLAAGIGDGGHGLVAEIPRALRDPAAAAAIMLQDTATGRRIGSELVVAWAEPAGRAPLAGNVDLITRDGWVSGWCWDPHAPDRRLLLDIVVDGTVAGSVEASEARPDLNHAAVGDGRYGFNFMLPYEMLADRGVVRVAVVEHGTGRPLGEPAELRIGRRAESDSRMEELERQIAVMRFRLEQVAQQPETEALAARQMFATVAGFFQGLAEGRPAAFVTLGGEVGGLAELRRTLPRLALRAAATGPDGRALATVAVSSGSVEAVHACLMSLHEAGVDRLAEIVLLAPSGADPRCALLPALVQNLRIGPTAEHAAEAFGRLLHDADTRLVGLVSPHARPEPGWLEALEATLAEEPAAAMAGAVVRRGDGSLQHAGLVLEGGGRLRDLGFLAAADLAEHRFLRPVDALAPLALLADRAGVAEAGGLDAGYHALAPAVADLCLSLRARGRMVLRQPGAACSWAGPDNSEPSCGEEDGRRLRLAILRHGRRDRAATAHFAGHALVVDADLPRPDRDAGSVAALEQMLALRRLGWRVTFAAAGGGLPTEAERRRLERLGIEVVDASRHPGVTDTLREHGANLQLVHLYRHRVAALLLPRVRQLAPAAKIVFSPADLHFVRETRQAALTGELTADQIAATKAQELACVRAADATILLSDHERDVLAAEMDPGKLHVLRWIARPSAVVAPFAGRAGLAFIGNFRHAPNVDAALWFARDVKPILDRMRPGLALDLVGADAPPPVLALQCQGIRVRGWVEDLPPLLASVRLTIAPLRYGAGFKGKVPTSLAAGVPVVGTSVAFEGMGLADGDGVAVADSAEAFARAIVGVHDGAANWAALSTRAIERVAALYSPAAADDFFRNLLSQLGVCAAQ